MESPLDILESALDQAFSAPPQLSADPKINHQENDAKQETIAETASSENVTSDDSWKIEYEEQVKSWRARSAEDREKAEKERLRWEAIRASGKADALKRETTGSVEESRMLPPQPQVEENWENVPSSSTSTSIHVTKPLSPSPIRPEPVVELPRVLSQQGTITDESQKWEDVPSVTSSYPSMSFPEHNDTPSPPRPQSSQQPPNSVTLAIFDPNLSTRTRVTAFFSSLAINLFLPFVNGVMLGFGEIFAKEVVMGWLGWKSSGPGSSATNIGIKPSPREERQRREGFR